ncbi:hypothetical protein NW851_09595 [Synechococcus sp. H55.7]|uniref:hypothetical protein n=1 Tax=unclassified Synechococcus TaxID=2626047 RepID=UPI0039C3840A
MPFHRRWRHSRGGSADRLAWPEKRLKDLDPPELRSDVSPPIQRLSDGMVF